MIQDLKDLYMAFDIAYCYYGGPAAEEKSFYPSLESLFR
jgi:hypothetical protein